MVGALLGGRSGWRAQRWHSTPTSQPRAQPAQPLVGLPVGAMLQELLSEKRDLGRAAREQLLDRAARDYLERRGPPDPDGLKEVDVRLHIDMIELDARPASRKLHQLGRHSLAGAAIRSRELDHDQPVAASGAGDQFPVRSLIGELSEQHLHRHCPALGPWCRKLSEHPWGGCREPVAKRR